MSVLDKERYCFWILGGIITIILNNIHYGTSELSNISYILKLDNEVFNRQNKHLKQIIGISHISGIAS